jgi:hypothetical protein
MSLRFASEQLSDLRHAAPLLIERGGDHDAAGTFSERMFYRLNVIHLIIGHGSEPRSF